MGRQAEKLRELMKEVRPLIHKDNVVCNRIVDCTYQQYLLNNKDNVKVIDEALATDGIKVMIAPTGSGKSYSLLSSVRRHIVGGANRTLISVKTPLRLSRTGTDRRITAE